MATTIRWFSTRKNSWLEVLQYTNNKIKLLLFTDLSQQTYSYWQKVIANYVICCSEGPMNSSQSKKKNDILTVSVQIT